MLKQDEYSGLRGLGHQSVIPYVHRDDCWIAMCVVQAWLNLPKRVCLLLSSVRPFIVQARTVTL
jgi:hypothetical protein